MKKTLLCILGVLCALTAFAKLDYLVIWHKDGTKVLFKLLDKPKVCYTGDIVTIHAGSTIEYSFQAIRKMTFVNEGDDVISALESVTERPFATNGQTVSFQPSVNDLHVRIVSLNGMVLKDFMVRHGEHSRFSFHPYPAGVYLLNINGVTYKIKTR